MCASALWQARRHNPHLNPRLRRGKLFAPTRGDEVQPLSLCLTVQYATRFKRVPERREFREWVSAALEQSVELTIRLVDEEEGLSLNQRYRRKGYATNVLTFWYGQSPNGALAGDVVLCPPVLAREARDQGKTSRAHFAHLTVHGVLHLQGYDHKRAREAAAMQARETQLLARLGYPDPYRI
jgi:probable rRNA maturation factor